MPESSALRGSLFDWLPDGLRSVLKASPLGATAKLKRLVIRSGMTLLLTGTVLAVMDLALRIQTHPSTRMSDFLRGDEQSGRVVKVWDDKGLLPLAFAHLGIDTFVLLPAYVIFGLALAILLDRELALDSASRLLQGVAWITAASTLLLALVDLAENASGALYLLGMTSEALIHFIGTAHGLKQIMAGVVLASLGILVACWYFKALD
jgi:hypothetical protein